MAANTFDVVVIGSVGIDTNVYFGGDGPDFTVESNFTENIDCIGQAGGYTSRGYARLAKKTAFIGYVGDDCLGKYIREEFQKDKIDTTAMLIDPAGTARSINFMYPDGSRKNFYDGKSHMKLTPDLKVCSTILSLTKLAHIHIPNWARRLLPIARESGAVIACDIQDVTNLNDEYRRDFVSCADILFFSTVNYASPEPFIRHFQKLNPQQIVIAGMGRRGCALGNNGKITYFKSVNLDKPVIDTNGAGDSLAVGFLSSYVLDHYPLEQAVIRGQYTARHCCTLKADSSHLITAAELDYYTHQYRKEK
jgi:sugar/nucleoside kinase (ribokinase family)